MILKKGTLDLLYVENEIANSSFSSKYLYARGRKLTAPDTGDNEFYFNSGLTTSESLEFDQIISSSVGKVLSSDPIKELFFSPNDAKQNVGSYSVNSVGKKSTTYFSFHIPNDYKKIESINVFFIPLFNETNDTVEISSTYGSVGEEFDQNQEIEKISIDYSRNKLSQVDVKSIYNNLKPNSVCGLKIDHDNIGGTVRYVGIEVRYYVNV